MEAKNYRLALFCGGGFLIMIDRFLKQQALTTLTAGISIQSNTLAGWFPLLNPGVAFGFPLPFWLTITFTVPLIVGGIFLVLHDQKTRLTTMLILGGALSNLYDRIVWGGTIDYFSFLGAVINIADMVIFIGVLGYFWHTQHQE